MNVKKITAAVMAAAVLAVAAPVMGVSDPIGVVASAADEKLITSPCPDGMDKWSYYALGNGYYYTDRLDEFWNTVPNKVIRVGDKELEQWRKTGTFTYTDVESEVDLSNMDPYSLRILDGCMQFKNGDNYYVMKVDESANKLVKVQEFSDGRNWSRTDGYSFSVNIDSETGVCTYTVYDPNGQKIENTLTYTSSGKGDFDYPKAEYRQCYGDKYVGYMTWMLPGTIVPGSGEESWNATAQFDIYGIKKDGSRDVIASAVKGPAIDGPGSGLIITSTDDYIAWKTDDCITIYTVDDGKTHKLSALGLKYGVDGDYSVESVIGSKAVIVSKKSFAFAEGIAQLVDISGEGKVLLEGINIEAIDNGNMYYFRNQDYKVGFLDSTGNLIGEWYDQAKNFKNDNLYTPVQKDNKWWLIDRNMNQVSEKLDGMIEVLGDDFFKYNIVDETGATDTVFATFANKVETDQPTKPTTPEKPAVKTVEYADKAADISAFANEGVIADGAVFTATPVADETKDNKLVYNFKFTKDGKEVQPKGSVTVKIPVPEALKGKTVYVYRAESNGTYTKMNTKVEGDLITFTTDHFSKYLITDEVIKGATEENPKTGIPETAVAMAAVAIAGAGIIVVSRKKR